MPSPELTRRFDPCERILDSDPATMRLTCVLTTEAKAADGLALSSRGFRLRSGGDSVPLLWYHGMDLRGGLPLGSVHNIRAERIEAEGFEGMALVGDKHYYQPGEAVKHLSSDLVTMPAVVYDMKRQGHFRAVSIGFNPKEILPDDQIGEDGVNVRTWDLYELSDCPVGMDPWALDRMLTQRGITGLQRDWLVGRECKHCGRCQEASEPQQTPIQGPSVVDAVIEVLTHEPHRRV